MGVRPVLAVFLLFIATVKAGGNVEFWRDTVTLTCPEEGTWSLNTSVAKMFTLTYDANVKPLISCEYPGDSPKEKYFFYVKGKACKDCYELDGKVFGLVIIADVIGTTIVMMVIYRCTKKKGSTGPAQPKPPSRSGPAPPTPSRDYEQLNVHTRSQDTYSIVNRTG